MDRDSSSQHASEERSLAWLLISALGNAVAAIVVGGVVAGRAGLPLSGPLLLAAGALGAAPRLVALLRGRWAWRPAALTATLLALAAVGLAGLTRAGDDTLPPGGSVDAVHHFIHARWIATRAALPATDPDTLGFLGEMAAYPPGMALLVVAGASLSGAPLLETLYPTVALLGGLIAALATLLALEGAGPRGENIDNFNHRGTEAAPALLALIVPLLLLAHRTYTLEAYTRHSFYAMVLGTALVLLAGCWLLVEPGQGLASAAQLGLASAALMGVYPLWAPIPLGLTALLLLARRPGVSAGLLQAALALGPALALALVDVRQRLALGQGVLEHQGVVTLPTLAQLLPLALALPAGALLLPRRRWALLALPALAAVELLALALATRQGLVASYHVYKVLHVIVPLACAVVAAGALELLALRPPARLAGLAALAVALAASGSLLVVPPPAEQPLTPAMVQAARWLRGQPLNIRRTAGVVGAHAGLEAYWLRVGLLGQRRDEETTALLSSAPLSIESWIASPRQPALVISVRPYEDGLGVEELARFEEVAILRRPPALLERPEQLNPLSISYRTFWEEGRVKTAVELLQPLPGPLPTLELALTAGGELVSSFRLQPDPARTRTQYLGGDVIPSTLGGMGYVNADQHPTFAPPVRAPSGELALALRLLIGERVVDERPLATFQRSAAGEIAGLATQRGELVYLRRTADEAGLRPVELRFADELALTGWHAPPSGRAGEPLVVRLRWQRRRQIQRPLLTSIALLDERGQSLAHDSAPPQRGFYPGWRWREGEPVVEQRQLLLPAGLAPGRYRLVAEVWDAATGQRLEPPGQLALLGVVAVSR